MDRKMIAKLSLCFGIQIFVYFFIVITAYATNNNVNNYKRDSLFKNLSLSSTNTWHELKINNDYLKNQNSAWMGSLTFKTKDAFKLEKLCLRWDGNFIDTNHIIASLYTKKETENQLIPIEKNLVVDGIWNKDQQEITFDLDEKLVAINKYYLVISFPEQIKTNLQKGSFNVCNEYLLIHKK